MVIISNINWFISKKNNLFNHLRNNSNRITQKKIIKTVCNIFSFQKKSNIKRSIIEFIALNKDEDVTDLST